MNLAGTSFATTGFGGALGPILRQKTLKRSIPCTGIGLHSGVQTRMTLHPAPENAGILFVRTDIGGAEIAADYDLVTETRLGTTLSNEAGISVTTVEHLMAALWGADLDNVVITLDGPEVPVMDGSAAPFLFLIECAGITEQEADRTVIRVLRQVEVGDDKASAKLTPADRFSVDLEIDFDHPAIDCQSLWFEGDPARFKGELSEARTFGFAHEVEALRRAGLARGGSLDNAVVLDESGVVNAEGLRFADEFVRHKVLDCIGDFMLAGHRLVGAMSGSRSGHALNNALLRALFADSDNWCLEPARRMRPAEHRYQVSAAR